MVHLEDIIWHDGHTSEYLEANCWIGRLSEWDFEQLVEILANTFHIPMNRDSRINSALDFIQRTKLDYTNCIKLYDKISGKIYGLLLVGNNKLWENSPIGYLNPLMPRILEGVSQVNGVGFIIDKRLRGKGFDKKMLMFNKEYFEQFDLVWHGVDKSLNTHDYWKRFGFTELLDDGTVKFYTKIID